MKRRDLLLCRTHSGEKVFELAQGFAQTGRADRDVEVGSQGAPGAKG